MPPRTPTNRVLINNAIRFPELRVIDATGKNLGVLTKEEAMKIAKNSGLDLIVISTSGDMPIAKITDYGRHQYDMSKKLKEVKAKSNITETKNIQLSTGISEHDIATRTTQAAEWIKEGNRVKFELKLKGRGKYIEENFLKERLNRVLAIIPCDYKIAEPLKKMPRGGFAVVIEKK